MEILDAADDTNVFVFHTFSNILFGHLIPLIEIKQQYQSNLYTNKIETT